MSKKKFFNEFAIKRFLEKYNRLFPEKGKANGDCLNFVFYFRLFFSDFEIFYNSNHLIVKYRDKFYDRNGEVEDVKDYLHWTEFGKEYFISAFANVMDVERIKRIFNEKV